MTDPRPQPLESFEAIDRMVAGYREAQILFAAVRLGLFDALGDGALDAATLAERLGADRRGTRILCDALAALGVLGKEGTGAEGDGQGEADPTGAAGAGAAYRSSPAAREFLTTGSPRSKVPMLVHGAKLYERWAGLVDAVTRGAPVPDDRIDPRLMDDEAVFAGAMAAIGRESAVITADALERLGALEGVRTALDLGGGPGLYAIELARRVPGLRVVVLDRPATLEVTRRNVEAAGLSEPAGSGGTGSVTTRPGDALEGDLGGPYDLVFTSNFLHIFPPEANRRLVARAAAALAPGGRLAVKDFLLDPDRITPLGGTLFAVNMLVGTEGGDSFTIGEVHGWFRDAGLEPEETVDLTAQSRLALGRKP
ncbi:MAG: methyltransferase dimerization domain-containing protein [Thermoanaerobaculia bacterium]